ncbi:MAG: hypothetical protein LBQ98_07345 [Nitrososphaerota archaeon]|jgi:hypothetical protein|nr:hypothetical protein [Nitrososphaerota archaeon]
MSIKSPIAVPILLFGRKKSNQPSTKDAANSKSKPPKLIGFPIVKYEIVDEKVKFYTSAGLFKKHWTVVKEFPIYELTGVESLDSWISLCWNDKKYQFILKPKGQSFTELVKQIAVLQEAHRKDIQKLQHITLHRDELLVFLNAALPLVDGAFDILMGLHRKHVDWLELERFVRALGGTFNFRAQTLAPLDLDFSSVSVAIQNQNAAMTAQEAFAILGAIYGYFDSFVALEDLADATPNFGQVRNIVLAYLVLNDLWFAKVVGEVDLQKEFDIFETQLVDLAAQTSFKAVGDEFRFVLFDSKILVDGVWNARQLYRDHLVCSNLAQIQKPSTPS